MANTWFNEDVYLQNKLTAWQAEAGNADKDLEALKKAIADAGMTPESHFLQFGADEGLSPNEFFVIDEYVANQVVFLNDRDGVTTWTADSFKDAVKAAGMTLWSHYQQYGWAEANPSNSFDADQYFADKLTALQEDPATKAEWAEKTVNDVKAAFEKAGIDPVSHYFAYGKDEGVAVTPVDAQPNTLTLTTGRDYVGPTDPETPADFAKVFKTTDGNDTIEGVVSSLTSEATLNATDVIDGGDGDDTLSLAMKASFAGFTADKGSVKNIENIVLTNDAAIAREFNATGVTGAKNYVLNSEAGAISLAQLGSIAAVTVNGQKEGNLNIGFASKVTDGTTDSLALTLKDVGTAAVKDANGVETSAAKHVALVTSGVETIAVTSTGDNYVNLSGATGSTGVNVSGAGATNISAVASTVTKFDGSAAQGAITANLSGAGTLTSIKTGAGDDKVTIDVTKVTANATIDGGAGNNTLVVAGGASTLQPKMENFQTLELAGLTGALTLSGKDITGLENVALKGASGNALGGQTLTLVGLTGSAANISTTGTQNGAIVSTGANAINLTTAASAATAKAQTAADAVSTTLSAAEASALTVNVGAYTNVSGAITAGKATSLNINVESGKSKDATPVELTTLGSTISAGKAQNVVIDAKGNLTSAVVQAGEATSVAVTTASDANTLTLTAGKATTVQLTAAKGLDLSNAATDLTSAENVSVTATGGHVNLGTEALSKANSLNVSGAGNASQFTVGAVGSGTLDYGTTLTATGLKGGLSVGNVATKAYDITLSLAGVTGAATIASVVANADAANLAGGNVTINAGGQTGSTKVTGAITAGKGNSVSIDASGVLGKNAANNAFESGAINAAGGTVTLNASNTLNAISTGAITAKNVSINAAGLAKTLTVATGITADNVTVAAASALDTVNVNLISAKATVNYTGTETKANTIAITAVDTTNGTKDTVTATVVGGILDDTVTITSGADALDIVNASIDLGVGDADTVKLVAGSGGFTSEALVLNGVEVLGVTSTAGSVAINASAISGKTIAVDGSAVSQVITLNGTANADTIDLTKVSVGVTNAVTLNIVGKGAADTIKLGANAENVVFTAATDGGATGDVITGFTSAADGIVIDGGLKTALGTLTTKVAGVAGTPTAFDTDTDAIGTIIDTANIGASAVTATALGDLTKVATQLNASFNITDGGAVAALTKIFAIESSDVAGKFGVYAWTQSADDDISVDAAELKLLGVVTGDDFAATDIVIA